jgi:hypothetical protein
MASTHSFICFAKYRPSEFPGNTILAIVFTERLRTGNDRNRRMRSTFGATKSFPSMRSSQPKNSIIRQSGTFLTLIGGRRCPRNPCLARTLARSQLAARPLLKFHSLPILFPGNPSGLAPFLASRRYQARGLFADQRLRQESRTEFRDHGP